MRTRRRPRASVAYAGRQLTNKRSRACSRFHLPFHHIEGRSPKSLRGREVKVNTQRRARSRYAAADSPITHADLYTGAIETSERQQACASSLRHRRSTLSPTPSSLPLDCEQLRRAHDAHAQLPGPAAAPRWLHDCSLALRPIRTAPPTMRKAAVSATRADRRCDACDDVQ